MDSKGFWLGVKAAVISSSCCSLPLALSMAFGALGAGSVTAALKLPKYNAFFLAAGTAFLLGSLYFTMKRKRANVCTLCGLRSEWALISVSLATYAVLTAVLIYVVLPAVSEAVFGAP
jgi:hypothetical protein